MPEQIIIALDCDNFYVAVARALDPRLHRIPVGITQKSLLATVSYEARALGLGKLQNTREAAEVVRRMGGEVVRLEDLREEHLVNGDGGDDQHRVIISPTTDPSPSCQTQTRKKPGKKAPRPLLVLVNGSDLTPFRRASKAVSWIVNTLLFGTTTPSPSNPPSPSFRSESPTRVNSSSVKAPLVAKRVKVEEGLEPAEEGSGSGDEEGDAEDAMHIYSVPMTSPDRAAAAVVRERTRTTLKRKRQGTTSKATSTAAAAAAEGNAHVQAQGRGEKGRASGCGCEKLGLDESAWFVDVD
ncbi:hypothetical protein QFC21_006387 [Naganishia friedmannii]|uniref:Uncharacterized protein n=1 Tax=Naganishia friedmannii TaxID=89922 RepID=A0ACC2V3F1_9TREE|nr:hypothetical protein QFC21_006387 [Naganishia friedmannii]